MSIEDMKLGNHYITKAYKGDDLIFDRNAPYYIQSTINYSNTPAGGGFIEVSGFELYSDYKYEVDVEIDSADATGAVMIGGSNSDAGGYGKGYCPGFFIASFDVSSILYSEEYGIAIIDHDSLGPPFSYNLHPLTGCIIPLPREPGQAPAFPIRQTFTFYNPSAEPWQTNTMSGRDAKRMTKGGFYLMAGRCELDNPPTVYDSGYSYMSPFYKNFGKLYRISIYDTDGTTLIHNFIPKIQNNHKGMIDTVTSIFYPCNDDTKFIIGK